MRAQVKKWVEGGSGRDSSEDRARQTWSCHPSTVKWWWWVPSAPSPLEALRRADSKVMRAGELAQLALVEGMLGEQVPREKELVQACHEAAGVQCV